MAALSVEILFILILGNIARWASSRLQDVDRLPMQWGLTGQVTWFAPRPLALAFIPALAACTFVSLTLLSLIVRPRPGQEGMVLPAFIGMGVLFLGIQLCHLWLVHRTLRRNGS